MSELRLRAAARAIVLDDDDRVLLAVHGAGESAIWVTPGGGIEGDETDEECVRRELLEETGLESFVLGPHVWSRTAHAALGDGRWDGETERIYLVHTPAFEPSPRLSWAELRAEGMTDVRWWTLEELEATRARLAPRRLASLLRDLIQHGPPTEPIDVGP